MSSHRFTQVDVFTDRPLLGNPLAVVHDADNLSDAQMQAFARWTNLSETTFLLRPTDAAADYRLRIFTPQSEFKFAGHPTLGSCHAWLQAGGVPRSPKTIVQQCGVGLVRIAQDAQGGAFAAPPLQRAAVSSFAVERASAALGLPMNSVVHSQWLDNGSGWWLALVLQSAAQVMGLRPDFSALASAAATPVDGDKSWGKFGLIAPQAVGHITDYEVRAFVPAVGINEDPVTGGLNAALAQWLMDERIAPAHYSVSQGAALGRAGRVTLARRDGTLWVGGQSVSCIRGELSL